MSRGPRIKPEEIEQAHKLKAEGKPLKAIAEEMKRSLPTVAKLLLLNKPVKNDEPALQGS